MPTNRSGEVRLTWTPPADDGGAAVTDYRIRRYDGTTATWTWIDDGVSISTSYTVTGLVNGRWYNFAVYATNEAGTGPYINAMAKPRTTPSAPASLTAVPTYKSGEVRLTWTPPTSDGGSPVTDYVLRRYDGVTGVWTTIADGVSTGTSYTVTGLVNGRWYNFIVSTVTGAGTGPYISKMAMPRTVPSAPRSLTATSTNVSGQIRLSWTAPASNGGVSILDYVIQRSPNGSSGWTTIADGTSTATSYTVTGLTNGTRHYFRVFARNQVGTSPASNVVSTFPGRPSPPTSFTVEAFVDGYQLTWSPPTYNGGSPIRGYVVQEFIDGAWRTLHSGLWTGTSGWVDATGYGCDDFRVAAVNTLGTGTFAYAFDCYPPGPPQYFQGHSVWETGEYHLFWYDPADADPGNPFGGYVLEYSDDGGPWRRVQVLDYGTNEIDLPGRHGPCRDFRLAAYVGNARSEWVYTDVC